MTDTRAALAAASERLRQRAFLLSTTGPHNAEEQDANEIGQRALALLARAPDAESLMEMAGGQDDYVETATGEKRVDTAESVWLRSVAALLAGKEEGGECDEAKASLREPPDILAEARAWLEDWHHDPRASALVRRLVAELEAARKQEGEEP